MAACSTGREAHVVAALAWQTETADPTAPHLVAAVVRRRISLPHTVSGPNPICRKGQLNERSSASWTLTNIYETRSHVHLGHGTESTNEGCEQIRAHLATQMQACLPPP